jgi:hypothetical protein
VQAALDGAEAEMVRLRAVKPEPALPPLDQVVAAAGGWAEIVAGTDVQAQRDILGDLVERVTPLRVKRGMYEGQIQWTPLGRALRQLQAGVTAA